MKRLAVSFVLILVLLVAYADQSHAATYRISGNFDGCDYGKLYELVGGGILECREYNYFYEYSPEVRTDGREVIAIGDEVVDAYVHDGGVITTQIDGEFEGCDYDKRYRLANGLVFVCGTYSYSYSYRPEVKIFIVGEGVRQVTIDGERYEGTVYE